MLLMVVELVTIAVRFYMLKKRGENRNWFKVLLYRSDTKSQ